MEGGEFSLRNFLTGIAITVTSTVFGAVSGGSLGLGVGSVAGALIAAFYSSAFTNGGNVQRLK